MTTLRQQIMMKRTLRNLRTWAPPISIGVIIGVLAYFAAEKLSERPTHAAATATSPQQARAQRSAEALPLVSPRRDPVVGASYASTPFGNCAAARTAGAAPVHAGEPGYGAHLDGDGIGCEPFHP